MQELGKTVGLTAMTGSRRLTSEKKRSSHRAKERRLGRDPSKHKGFTSKKKTLRLPASCLLEFPTDWDATAAPSRHGFSVTASSWDEMVSLHRPAKGRRGRLGGPEGRWRSCCEVPKAFAIATAINPLILLRGKLTDQSRLVPSFGTQLPPEDLSRISIISTVKISHSTKRSRDRSVMRCNSRKLVASPLPCGHRFTTRRLLGLRPPASLILLPHTAPPSATTNFCRLHHHSLPAQPLR